MVCIFRMKFILVTLHLIQFAMPKPKKRKIRGVPFKHNDPRINKEGQPPAPTPDISSIPSRFRESKAIYDQISTSKFGGGVPIGARLRPKADCDNDREFHESSERHSQNWVVDEEKLFQATNDALQCHDKGGKRNHTPILKKQKINQAGFGISVSFTCGFKNCGFSSASYKLYEEGESGCPLTNARVGVAMAKSELTPRTMEVLGTTLNLATPARSNLQRHYTKSLQCSKELADEALAENRGTVTAALRLLGEVQEGEIPTVDVATDGQYSNRSYHFPTGKSDSVSAPVIEHVTGLGLMVEHENLSHRDGTLAPDVHINSAETLAAQKNVEKAYSADKYPLFFGTVTTDGDTSVAKALETAREEIGESRPLKRRGCHFHGEGAGRVRNELDFEMNSFLKLS